MHEIKKNSRYSKLIENVKLSSRRWHSNFSFLLRSYLSFQMSLSRKDCGEDFIPDPQAYCCWSFYDNLPRIFSAHIISLVINVFFYGTTSQFHCMHRNASNLSC